MRYCRTVLPHWLRNSRCSTTQFTHCFECGSTARASNNTKHTIVDFERGARSPHASTLFAIQTAFENAGITFIEEDADGKEKVVGLTYRRNDHA